MILSCICADLAAASISSSDAPNLPYLMDEVYTERGQASKTYPMLYAILELNKIESWGTTPMACRNDFCVTSLQRSISNTSKEMNVVTNRISWPSMRILPSPSLRS